MARTLVIAAAIVWIACIGMSLYALTLPPEGDSFLRGANRLQGFLSWQLGALAAAIVGAVALRRLPAPRPGLLRLLGIGPAVLSAMVLVAIVGLVLWAVLAPPPPPEPAGANPPQVTAPAG